MECTSPGHKPTGHQTTEVSRRHLFAAGLFSQIAFAVGVVLIYFVLPMWILLVVWLVLVAWAGANLFGRPGSWRVAGWWSLWGTLGFGVLGVVVFAVLEFLGGMSPHAGSTPPGDIVLAAINGGLGAAVVGLVLGFVVGGSIGASLRSGRASHAPADTAKAPQLGN